MISANFRGQMLAPAGVPPGFSVYASYDATRGAEAVLLLNKTTISSPVTLALEPSPPRAVDCPPLSLTLVTIADASGAAWQILRYTGDMADAGLPPQPAP
jgi:hypothetical protein